MQKDQKDKKLGTMIVAVGYSEECIFGEMIQVTWTLMLPTGSLDSRGSQNPGSVSRPKESQDTVLTVS